jgi:hypothetical protein
VLSFNDSLVERSRAEPVSEGMKEEIRKIVEEARTKAPPPRAGGWAGGAGGGASYLLDEVDELLQDGVSDVGQLMDHI